MEREQIILVGNGDYCRLLLRDFDQHLAEVLALQEAEKGSGRLLQTVHDVLAVFEAALPDPRTRIAQEISLLCTEIRDDESPQEEALAQDRKHVGTGHRVQSIVLRNEPADGNAGE